MWNMCQVCPSSWTTNSVRPQAGSCSQGLVVTSIILQFESVFDMKHVVFKSMCPWQEPEGQQHCTFRKTFKLVYRLQLVDVTQSGNRRQVICSRRWLFDGRGDAIMHGLISWCMFLPVFLSHISLFLWSEGSRLFDNINDNWHRSR